MPWAVRQDSPGSRHEGRGVEKLMRTLEREINENWYVLLVAILYKHELPVAGAFQLYRHGHTDYQARERSVYKKYPPSEQAVQRKLAYMREYRRAHPLTEEQKKKNKEYLREYRRKRAYDRP